MGDYIITIPIAIGELVDKMTILEIKLNEIKDANKLAIVKRELALLSAKYAEVTNSLDVLQKRLLDDEYNTLAIINKKLWDIEDDIRIKEKHKEFDQEFIQLARNVYYTNDERCVVKNKINAIAGSYISEVKSYNDYK
jgi:hypothetical protein